MPAIIPVESPADPRVAEYVAVPDGELLRARGLFVAEGRLVVRGLLQDSRFAVRSLLLSGAAHAALASDLLGLVPGVPVYVCPVESFRALTGFNLHRGCLALVERRTPLDVTELVRAASLVVALEE